MKVVNGAAEGPFQGRHHGGPPENAGRKVVPPRGWFNAVMYLCRAFARSFHERVGLCGNPIPEPETLKYATLSNVVILSLKPDLRDSLMSLVKH
jgi:hypothetical protein